MNGFKVGQEVKTTVVRNGGNMNENKLNVRGEFLIEHIRNGETINDFRIKNGIVNEGLDALLDIMFHNGTQIATWYLGLVDNAGFSAFAASDTMSSHAGWAESVAYSDANRIEWTEGAASSQSITNGTPVTFNINASATIKGVFLTSDNTKSGSIGTLWASAAFSSTVAVQNGDQLKVTYTVNAASA